MRLSAAGSLLGGMLFVFFAFSIARADSIQNAGVQAPAVIVSLNPADGAEIEDRAPMISAVTSGPVQAMDPRTVTVTLNGNDVTDSAEITPAYVIYTPDKPLKPGTYVVRITGVYADRKAMAPLSWTFSVMGGATPLFDSLKGTSTSGHLKMSTDYVSASYVPMTALDVTRLFGEKEGFRLNTDFDFLSVSPGRTISGAYTRETQSYTGTKADRGRIDYADSRMTASAGYFRMSLSDLTVAGVELGGVRLDRDAGPWNLTLFSGRTQDPSTDGTFKQVSSGFRGAYTWNKKDTSYLTLLTASERQDAFYGQFSTPADDSIAALRHEHKFNDALKSSLELALNRHRQGALLNAHDEAWKFSLLGAAENFSAQADVYRIGENFFPVAEGSAKYFNNNRNGYRMRMADTFLKKISAGGEFEEYDTADSAGITTKNRNAFVAYSSGNVQSLSYSEGKLTVGSAASKTRNANVTFAFSRIGSFDELRLTSGLQDIRYSAPTAISETKIFSLGAGAFYRNRLGASMNFSNLNTNDLLSFASVSGKSYSLGLTWNIVPNRLVWTGGWELMKNSGTGTDNEEKRLKTTIKYITERNLAVDLGFDTVDYKNNTNTFYNYSQDIIRTGVEWNF